MPAEAKPERLPDLPGGEAVKRHQVQRAARGRVWCEKCQTWGPYFATTERAGWDELVFRQAAHQRERHEVKS